MKKAILAIMVLGLCFGLANAAMAQEVTDSTTVTVTVNEIETLTVPDTVAITLNTVDATDPSKYATGTFKGTGENGLTYTHNSADPKKITATAVADTGNADNDITLAVAIGTQTAQAIVTEGTPTTGAVDVWTEVPAGSDTVDLNWTADATLAGTLAGSYGWTVEFTLTDVE